MSHSKNAGEPGQTCTLDQIAFENVSLLKNGSDPILRAVDLLLPMDQTIIVQSSIPEHAALLLEVLAGRHEPQSGRVLWDEDSVFERDEADDTRHDLVGCYFENQRPAPKKTLDQIFHDGGANRKLIADLGEHFELDQDLSQKFQSLVYEKQKLALLISATLKNPQMLVLEDPATGLSEKTFLQFLDWVQLGQRQGHLRHLFLTNNHPAALRHLDCSVMYLEDGLVYFEENQKLKKAVHF